MVGIAPQGLTQGSLGLTRDIGISGYDEQFRIGIPFIRGRLSALKLQDARLRRMCIGKIAQTRFGFCQKLVSLNILWPPFKSCAQFCHQLCIVRVSVGVICRRARLRGCLV